MRDDAKNNNKEAWVFMFNIGVGFEIYEFYTYECHDALDIVFNTVGFLAGRAVRMQIA